MQYEAPTVEARLALLAQLGVIAQISNGTHGDDQPIWRPAKPQKP